MSNLYLGIDTSAYTSSICLVDEQGKLVYEKRKLLKVREGERGLRQSEATYQHMNHLGELFEGARPFFKKGALSAIAVSERPENREDSYMPVFRAGISGAKMISSVYDVPLFYTSHQENHLAAARYGLKESVPDQFLAVHFSGGTSQILLAEEEKGHYSTRLVAQSLDLKAGQLIDRTGVLYGLGFPAGKELDRLAFQNGPGSAVIRARMEGANFHFSGQENQIIALKEEGYPAGEVAYALFQMIAKTLEQSIRRLKKEYSFDTVLFSGGVMASQTIAERLKKRLSPTGIRLQFANPYFSSDHAFGNAHLARIRGQIHGR